MEEIITGFKATDKDLKCRGFQYEIGKWYEEKKDISLCNNGFHFCVNPLDILDYYNLCDSEFHIVEAKGKIEGDGKKSVTNNLKISATIGLPGFVKASVEYISSICKIENPEKEDTGDYSKLAASGYYSKLAASGDYSQLAASGEDSVVAGIGTNNTAKGAVGCWITLAEWELNKRKKRYVPVCVKSARIDGKRLKANVFYKLENKIFIEVK